MTAELVDVPTYRAWAGASVTSVPDDLIQQSLDEAEASLVVDVFGPHGTVDGIRVNAAATSIATGDVKRRTQNLVARRNSPEGYAGVGDDGIITVPAGEPGSPAAVARIRRILGLAAGGRVVVA